MKELMTLAEVADYLRFSKDTIYRIVQDGRLPSFKVGNQWRFRKKEIDDWFLKKNIPKDKKTGKSKGR